MKQKTKELIQALLIFLCVFCIHTFVIGTVRVQGQSMYPTLNNEVENDRIVVEKISTYSNFYRRGEIVIFKPEKDSSDIYVKRIIGLPNDIVEILDGKLYVNGEELKEDYLIKDTKTYPSMKVKVPQRYIFVLGDNRVNSVDSRKIGSIPIENIKGHALYRFNILKFSGNKLE